jgi:dienelactone hydrolase
MGFWKLGFLETFLLLTGAVSIATAQPSPLQPGLQSQSGEPTNIPQIPAPSGPFGVGRVSYEWIDVARPDGHSSDPQAHRDLMVHLWYPAQKGKAGKVGEYLPGAKQMDADPAVRSSLQEEFESNWPLIVSGAITSHAIENASVARSPQRFPVVLLAHGLGGTSFEYTALLEDLASHGYVVAAVENTYIAAAVVFPDGRIIGAYHEPETPGLSPEQRFQRMMKGAGEAINTGAEDLMFVLNRLTDLNQGNEENSVLRGRLDLNRVAAIGHSAGGANATLACELDPRFKACISLDGAMPPVSAFPENPAGKWFTQPVLLLEADHTGQRRGFDEAQNDLYLKKKEDQLGRCPAGSYDVVLKAPGLVHGSFSDYSLLAAMGRPADTETALHNLGLTESYIAAFLDASLNHGKSSLLEDRSDHPEATVKQYGRR